MICGSITVLSYVGDTAPARRCCCAECSPAWRAIVALAVTPPWSLEPEVYGALERRAVAESVARRTEAA